MGDKQDALGGQQPLQPITNSLSGHPLVATFVTHSTQLKYVDICESDEEKDDMDDMYSCETESSTNSFHLPLIAPKQRKEMKQLKLFRRDTVLKWQVLSNDFTTNTAIKLIHEFKKVIIFMKLEHLFQEVTGQSQSPHIRIRSAKNDGYYACSFFPPSNGDLMVTRHLLELGDLKFRRVLEHEIGHVLGFRHEFTSPDDSKSLKIGDSDPLSFMSYSLGGMTENDVKALDLIYGLDPDGSKEELFQSQLPKSIKYQRIHPEYSTNKF